MSFGSSPFSIDAYSAPSGAGSDAFVFSGTCSTSYGVFSSPHIAYFTGVQVGSYGEFSGAKTFVPRPIVAYIDGAIGTTYGGFTSRLPFYFVGVQHAKAGIFQGILNRVSGAFYGTKATQYGEFSNATPGYFGGAKATQYGQFVGLRPTLGSFVGTKSTRHGYFDSPSQAAPMPDAVFVSTKQLQVFVIG